jgi:hypothetical protein
MSTKEADDYLYIDKCCLYHLLTRSGLLGGK